MVVLFQPFTGNWTQILGVFASRGNVKEATLSKIIVETTILAEQAGLFVDTRSIINFLGQGSVVKLKAINITGRH
ncbi:hypothetical protein V5799_029740 [Amblyomma americanum]|uniref:Uncharacterized protein n=1 Tax=Amblyomma americanum TaxID=6943 RepID=A0AAQ4EQE6_AMBAM